MRTKFNRFLASFGATIALTVAVALIISTGLPRRDTFTGIISEGQLIAPERNAFAPQIEKITLTGNAISLHHLRGDPVIINFWATWCVPCQIEMPILQTLYDTYNDEGLRIIAVNMGEPPRIVSAWINEFGFSYDVVLDLDQTLFNNYQVRGQPSTFIISPSGIITDIFYGPAEQRQLTESIADFFIN